MYDRMLWQKGINVKRIIILLIATILTVNVKGTLTTSAEEDTIRVGYVEQCGFMEETHGVFEGYGVEYLNEISNYTGWRYEYVYETWESCLEQLESGNIDIVCMAQYAKDRAEKFLYSDIPLGYEYTVLYARTDADIYYEDYEAMKGCKVGLLKQSMHSEEFVAFAKNNGIDCDEIYFDSERQAIEALKNGEVDLAAVGSLHVHTDVKVVGRFEVRPYYCITGRQNAQLMDELNEAMRTLKIDNSEVEMQLSLEYYGDGRMSSYPLFTKEEQEFIWKSEPVRVKLMEGAVPLSYMENGEAGGIFVEYIKLLSEKSGLEFSIEMESTPIAMDEQTRQVLEDNYLMLRSKRAIESNGLEDELITSNPLLSTQLSYVVRRSDAVDGVNDARVIAITQEMGYLPVLIRKENPEYIISYQTSTKDCLEAVLNGKADVAIQDSYVVAHLLEKPEYAEHLVESPGKKFTNGMCLIASEDQAMLIGIINKTINFISQDEKDALISREQVSNPYEQDLSDLLYEYKNVIIFVAIILVIAIVIYTILMHRMATLRIKRNEYQMLEKRVQQDELTGVYNRSTFFDKAREMLESSEEPMYIVLLDIVNFKVVNDLYGMAKSDHLLRFMAKQLKDLCKGREYIIARFTGDHFYMCVKEADFNEISFPKRYKTFLKEMEIKVIYGVFKVEDRDLPINIMCDRASLAVHDKDQNRHEYIRFYNDDERKRIIQEQEIENDMEQAVEERQFSVYVQPKYDIAKEKIIGGEALVRWLHPMKGMISPGVFINVFEKNGFIIRLDYYVWEETCRLLSEMKKQGLPLLTLSINVSRAHFYGNELQDKLEELVAKYGLEPSDLELEITETICAEDTDAIYTKIRKLQAAGFKVAMDDFGSGYSSLNMLKEMPLDIIKMDLKFLDGGDDEDKSRNILKTLILLAHSLNLSVVVEGVETREQVEFLKEVGGCSAQGYYYSRPVEVSVYEGMLKKNHMG